MTNRVLWLPTGPRSKSSSRIQVYNIHDKLLSLGYNSVLLHEPKRTIRHLPIVDGDIASMNLGVNDLVIIQKFKKKSTLRTIKKLKETSARVGYIDCDVPIASEIAKLVDFVIVPSRFLQKRYQELGVSCYYIQDSPEHFHLPVPKTPSKGSKLKCVWFGNHSHSKWKEVTYFKRILRKHGVKNWQFETISNTWRATHRWDEDSFGDLSAYDLVAIPVPNMTLDYQVKSANRLLQSMALGLPVLASPIPSYSDVIESENLEMITCESEEEWVQMLNYYADADHRASSIEKNYKVAKSFDLDLIIEEWIDAFQLIKTKNLNGSALDPIKVLN